MMTQEEASKLVRYYDEHPQELTSMKHEIGANHPASRYIEALEKHIQYLEDEYILPPNTCALGNIRDNLKTQQLVPAAFEQELIKAIMQPHLQHDTSKE